MGFLIVRGSIPAIVSERQAVWKKRPKPCSGISGNHPRFPLLTFDLAQLYILGSERWPLKLENAIIFSPPPSEQLACPSFTIYKGKFLTLLWRSAQSFFSVARRRIRNAIGLGFGPLHCFLAPLCTQILNKLGKAEMKLTWNGPETTWMFRIRCLVQFRGFPGCNFTEIRKEVVNIRFLLQFKFLENTRC